MANSAVVTSLAAGKVFPKDYLGNVEHIPLVFTTDGVYSAEAMVFSEVLPPDTNLIGIHLTTTAIANGELDIGYTGDADAIIDGADLTSAGNVNYQAAPVEVGGKKIIGTLTGTMSTDSIAGYILVVSNV